MPLDPIVGQAWATFNALRRLGFPPEWIYLATYESSREVRIELHSGDHAFSIRVGEIPRRENAASCQAGWKKFVESCASGEISDLALQAEWDVWQDTTDLRGLLRGLVANGFKVGEEVARG